MLEVRCALEGFYLEGGKLTRACPYCRGIRIGSSASTDRGSSQGGLTSRMQRFRFSTGYPIDVSLARVWSLPLCVLLTFALRFAQSPEGKFWCLLLDTP
jgi:hypothetical protein